MSVLFAQLAAWLGRKLAIVGLIVAGAVLLYALWLLVRDLEADERARTGRLEALLAEKERLTELREEVGRRIEGLRADLGEQRRRVERANAVLRTFEEMQSWWDRLFTSAEERERQRRQAERVEQLRGEALAALPRLERALLAAGAEQDSLAVALGRTVAEIETVQRARSAILHYLVNAWARLRPYLIGAIAAYLFGPTVWKLVLYYGLAPLVAGGTPLRLRNGGPEPLPTVSASHVSADVLLGPGERLLVKESYLQASDEGLRRKTRFLLDWRIPFTSLACGLSELIEMRNPTPDAPFRVTLSNAEDPHVEVAVVDVPEGGSLVLRPSYLAAVVTPENRPLRIRRRWTLGRWLAWVNLRFRHFEFAGPCRLVVAGSRGIRAERLAERDGRARAARRTNQEATIGFSPGMDYLPVRAETFWAYYRSMNPLFDDLFIGPGIFLCQETARPGEGRGPGSFWAAVWGGVLKVFGV